MNQNTQDTSSVLSEGIQPILASLQLFVDQFKLIKPYYFGTYADSVRTLSTAQRDLEFLQSLDTQDIVISHLDHVFNQLKTVRRSLPVIRKEFRELLEVFDEDVDTLKQDIKHMCAAIGQLKWMMVQELETQRAVQSIVENKS